MHAVDDLLGCITEGPFLVLKIPYFDAIANGFGASCTFAEGIDIHMSIAPVGKEGLRCYTHGQKGKDGPQALRTAIARRSLAPEPASGLGLKVSLVGP